MLGCQRRVLVLLCVFFLHQPLMSSSLSISYTWILVLGHQTTPRNLHSSNHKSTKCCSSCFLTHQATQTAPSKQGLVSLFHTPEPLCHFLVRQPISPMASGISTACVGAAFCYHPSNISRLCAQGFTALEVHVLVSKCICVCSVHLNRIAICKWL